MATTAPPVEEGSDEERRQVEGLYASLQSLFAGVDDVITCKTVAVFVAGVMVASENWKAVIPEFMNHRDMCSNVALTDHRKQEQANAEQATAEEGKSEEAKG